MTILRKNLLDEIELAKTKLDSSKIHNFVEQMFKKSEDDTILNASIQDGDNAKRKEEVIRNFKRAWDYSMQHFSGEFDLVYLTDVAGIVEPYLKKPGVQHADFRDRKVSLNGLGYVAPADRTRVMANLEGLLASSKDAGFHPVESAIFHYFHLIRIQPFENANKRTANIVMNTILNYNGFLPITIPPQDVALFNDFLVGALRGFREAGSHFDRQNDAYLVVEQKQNQLFDYLGRRELSNLRNAENAMAGLTSYRINLDANSPAILYSVKHNLSSWFKSRRMLYQVRLDTHAKELIVTGEIPLESVHKILSGINGVKHPKVNILSSGSTQY